MPTESGKTRSYGLLEALRHPQGVAEPGSGDRVRQVVHLQGLPGWRTTPTASCRPAPRRWQHSTTTGKLLQRRRPGGGVHVRRAAVPAGHADLVSAVLERGEHLRSTAPPRAKSPSTQADAEHRRGRPRGNGAMTAAAAIPALTADRASPLRAAMPGSASCWSPRSSSPCWRWCSTRWSRRCGTACTGSIRCRPGRPFIGLANYSRMLTDSRVSDKAWTNTVIYVVDLAVVAGDGGRCAGRGPDQPGQGRAAMAARGRHPALGACRASSTR